MGNFSYDQKTKTFAKELEKEAKKFEYRLYQNIDNDERSRNEHERDYARILYSSSFRRLQGKMQFLGVDHNSFHRNRLTHSLEVAQIARSVASSLDLESSIVAESCSLAHDIGNPPFGHAGEKILDSLSKKIGGYEGNAQVIRIFRTLETKYPNSQGLNLTVRTLLGLTKYFYTRKENDKKFLYDDDYKILNDEWEKKNVNSRRTIDVQIMDLSDEIAYAAHDLEDSLSMGHMTLSELLYEFKVSEKYKEMHPVLSLLVQEAQKYAGSCTTFGSSERYATVLKKELTSKIVHILIKDIGVIEKSGKEELGFKNYSLLSEGLKKLVFKTILRKRNIQMYEKLGDKVISGLFTVYTDYNFNKEGILLPEEYRNNNDECIFKRSVVDYISGMMDSYAITEYNRYYGESSLAKLYNKPII